MHKFLTALLDTSGITNWMRSYDVGLQSMLETFQSLTTIQSFRRLPENWDGEGSVAFKDATIANSYRILELVTGRNVPAPDVSPNPHGTVALEWENDRGYAYVEVGASQLTALIKNSENQIVFSLDRVDATRYDLLRQLTSNLRSHLYPGQIAELANYLDITELAPRWSQPLFVDTQELTNQSLVAQYAIDSAY